jgi:hypothetical protein
MLHRCQQQSAAAAKLVSKGLTIRPGTSVEEKEKNHAENVVVRVSK